MWVNLKCPHCGGIARKVSVNPSVDFSRHTGVKCDKCYKKIAYEMKYGKVRVFKD